MTYLSERNRQLADLLTDARAEITRLRSAVEELATPPLTFGLFTGWEGDRASVWVHNRKLIVSVSPDMDASELAVGKQVLVGEGEVIVGVAGYPRDGELAHVAELLDGGSAVITSITGERAVVRLADHITEIVEAGATVLVDRAAGLCEDVVPVTEIKRLNLAEVPDVTWADIGGLDEQIAEIQDAVELPFAHPELYKQYHLTPPKGVLLYGPPGCGKTLIAKAVANSLATRLGGTDAAPSFFLNIKGPELLNKFVGETERQIRVVFEQARDVAEEGRPVIIFFDEMESIFRTRGSGVSSDMETTVVPQLLAELDGVEQLSNVIIIGATNREELIDPAILRPGRLDMKIRIDRPDRAGAVDIFSRYLTKAIPTDRPPAELIELAVDQLFEPRPFVELTLSDGSTEVLSYADFVSGALIANVVDRAKKLAIKATLAGKATGITPQMLTEAIEREQAESEGIPNTQSTEEWTRIIGRRGAAATVVSARVIAQERSQ